MLQNCYAMRTFPDSFNDYFTCYFLFICSLFNNAFSSSDCIVLNDRMMVNNEKDMEGSGRGLI
jgi:hypothetical protein